MTQTNPIFDFRDKNFIPQIPTKIYGGNDCIKTTFAVVADFIYPRYSCGWDMVIHLVKVDCFQPIVMEICGCIYRLSDRYTGGGYNCIPKTIPIYLPNQVPGSASFRLMFKFVNERDEVLDTFMSNQFDVLTPESDATEGDFFNVYLTEGLNLTTLKRDVGFVDALWEDQLQLPEEEAKKIKSGMLYDVMKVLRLDETDCCFMETEMKKQGIYSLPQVDFLLE